MCEQIAGGTGITPMLQVASEVLKNPDDKTEVSLIFGNLTEDDILLRKHIDQLAKSHKNFKVQSSSSSMHKHLGSSSCSMYFARIHSILPDTVRYVH